MYIREIHFQYKFPTLVVFPLFTESLGLRSEMQNKHETTPGLCETALGLGDQNLRDHDHRHL